MDNTKRALVNQRLYFCRLHLKWMQEALEKKDIPGNVVEQSLAESVLFHLVQAYRLYLAEIATAYNSPCETLNSISELNELLSKQQQASAEAHEIAQQEASGWLATLLSAYEAIPAAAASPKPGAVPQQIPVTQLQTSVLNYEQCKILLQSMESLIENQRSRLEEW